MIEKVALTSAALHLVVALFQLALVSGAPWGAYAWGGQHAGRLPTKLRVASFAGIVLLLSFAAINLQVAGWLVIPGDLPLKGLQYAVTIYAGLGTVINFLSRSRKEQLLWTPVTAILLLLNWIILKSL